MQNAGKSVLIRHFSGTWIHSLFEGRCLAFLMSSQLSKKVKFLSRLLCALCVTWKLNT
jgi:hypothetical protein